ncbi:hypothetical protein VKT23_009697 [Stygiomarasmius scandens]|uniref:F-box domain-containing protein n=1 Tax=Marasmiellus scandens TaxID=2682957 RepID=A0ABR1JJ05_9AGAR
MTEQLQLVRHITFIPASTNQFNKLPTETITNIFLFACLSPRPHHPHRIDPEYPLPELALSAVCHQWRDIFLKTPYLWTQLQVVFPFGINDKEVEGVMCWLKRTKGNDGAPDWPLDIHITADRYSRRRFWKGENAADILPPLVGSLNRWRDFLFVQPIETIIYLLGYMETRVGWFSEMKLLETFDLVVTDNFRFYNVVPDRAYVVFPHTGMKALKRMGFASTAYPTNILDYFELPTSAPCLTTIKLTNVTSLDQEGLGWVRGLLLRYPTLEEAWFEEVYHLHPPNPALHLSLGDLDGGSDSVPNLKHLFLQVEAFGFDVALVNLKLPKLERLSLKALFTNPSIPTTTDLFDGILLRLQENSRFPLKSLTLHDINVSVDYLDQFLRGVNGTLEALSLPDCHKFQFAELVDRLNYGYPDMRSLLPKETEFWLPSPMPVLPRLSKLLMVGSSSIPGEIDGVVTFVLRRACTEGWTSNSVWDRVVPLRNARIQFNGLALSFEQMLNLMEITTMQKNEEIEFKYPLPPIDDPFVLTLGKDAMNICLRDCRCDNCLRLTYSEA